MQQAGAALLERWQTALATYNEQRSEFERYTRTVSLTPEQAAYVAELRARADSLQGALARVGDWLIYGRDLWGALKPLADAAGLSGVTRFGPLAGVGVLAVALKQVRGISRQMDDANRHMRALPVKGAQ